MRETGFDGFPVTDENGVRHRLTSMSGHNYAFCGHRVREPLPVSPGYTSCERCEKERELRLKNYARSMSKGRVVRPWGNG